MDKQYLNYLISLDKKGLINVIEGLNQEIAELHNKLKANSIEANNNAVSDTELAIIKALRDMMSNQALAAIEVHNNDYHS